MKNKLALHDETKGNRFRVTVEGELDMDSSPSLLDVIRKGLGQSTVEIHLEGVTYIDSSGIAVLVHGYKLARRKGVEYEILDPSKQVMAVIQLSQLHNFFTIRSSEPPA